MILGVGRREEICRLPSNAVVPASSPFFLCLAKLQRDSGTDRPGLVLDDICLNQRPTPPNQPVFPVIGLSFALGLLRRHPLPTPPVKRG